MSPLGTRCTGEAGRVERSDLQLRQSAMRKAANVHSLYGIEADAGLRPKRKAVVHTWRKLPRHRSRNRRLNEMMGRPKYDEVMIVNPSNGNINSDQRVRLM